MTRISLAEASFYRLGDPCKHITSVDPYKKTAIVDRGTMAAYLTWEEIKAMYQVEIVPTAEELEMIEKGRLTIKVEEKARELRLAIEAWLFSPEAR